MTDLKLYKGVLIRPSDASDKPMINDCLKNYRHFTLSEDSRVLDLGGHIGSFSVMCRRAGVRDYRVYEANKSNYEVLQKNASAYDARYSAVSASRDPTVTFYHRKSKQASCSGTMAPSAVRSNMVPETVPNAFIDDVIEEFKPTHVKMDIEGAEKDILALWNYRLPSCVREFALEIHTASYCKQFYSTYTKLIEQEFDLVFADPAHGFINKGSDWEMFGFKANSVLYGFDLFYRRKA